MGSNFGFFGDSRSIGGARSSGPISVGNVLGYPFSGRLPYWVNGGEDADGNIIGSNSHDGLNPSDALGTIQEAIDRAQSGDKILIFPGSYVENLIVDAKDYISLIGAIPGRYGWPDIVPATGMALHSKKSQGLILNQLRLATENDADVARIEGNGFLLKRVIFDGDAQTATKCLLRLRGNATDDSYTGSEGLIKKCNFRGGGGIGIILDTGDAPTNGVGCTDDVIEQCIFQGITGADIATKDTGGGIYSAVDAYILRNYFRAKNKAVYIDMTTENGGAAGAQTGMIAGNYFNDDALDGTKIAIGGTGFVFVGNYDSVGVQDGSAFD